MYSSGLSGTFPVLCQFTQPTGRSGTQSSALANEFITKAYADARYTGGTPTTIQDATTTYRVTCTSANTQLYTALNTGTPSLYIRKSTDGTYTNYTELTNVVAG